MTMAYLQSIEYWHWWILAVVLLGLEALFPGAIFLWMGVAAVPVGLLLLIAPDVSWQVQLLVFAVLSVGSIVGWRAYKAAHPEAKVMLLNRRGQQLVGRRFTLNEPIVNGQGRAHVDDTMWRISGPDLPAGTTVSVTAAQGTVLVVAKA